MANGRQFKDKVVLITGGLSGIGKATALAFADEGATVAIADVRDEGSEELVDTIVAKGSIARFFRMNVADMNEVQTTISTVIDRLGGIDIAFNNAGIGGEETAITSYSEENWHEVLAVNLTGVFNCMKHELNHMIERKAGVIVNTASVAGIIGFPWHSAYAASKHGVIGLTKTAAIEVARHGIRINAICPGFTKTPMVQQMLDARPGLQEKLEKNMPVGRLADPEEIAQAVLFLCADNNKFMIGHSLILDGGTTAV